MPNPSRVKSYATLKHNHREHQKHQEDCFKLHTDDLIKALPANLQLTTAHVAPLQQPEEAPTVGVAASHDTGGDDKRSLERKGAAREDCANLAFAI